MSVRLVSEDRLPPGPKRNFVLGLRELYYRAGEPTITELLQPNSGLSVRLVRGMLSGAGPVPKADKLKILLRLLRARIDAEGDINEDRRRVLDLWLLAKKDDQDGMPVSRSSQPPTSPGPAVSSADVSLFKETRAQIGAKVTKLIPMALAEHAGSHPDGVPLLTAQGWIPDRPLPLNRVGLTFGTAQSDFSEAKRQVSDYWPAVSGIEYPSYSDAVGEYARPQSWFNGLSFRLLDVNPGAGRVDLSFAESRYWEAFDTCEPLGYEAALQYVKSKGQTINGRYRQWLGDPFDLSNRCGVPGVNTLTIRCSRREATFYLHKRTGVATAMDTNHVVPAGEFQRSGQQGEPSHAELNFESTIIREYTEEFLGEADAINPEHRLTQIHFESNPKYAPLYRAIRSGGAQVHYLGTGLYPLTWKPEVLMVCVIEGRVFDRIFREMLDSVEEGTLLSTERLKGFRYMFPGKKGPYQGLCFNEETVLGHANNDKTLPAARACLTLAWRHRKFLGIDH